MSAFSERRSRVTRRYNFDTLLTGGTHGGVTTVNGGNMTILAGSVTNIVLGAVNSCSIGFYTITRASGSYIDDGIEEGARLLGSNIGARFPANTRVVSVDDALTLTMSNPAASTGSNQAATFEPSLANSCEQRAEKFGQDNDLFSFAADGKGFWQRRQYLSCFVIGAGGYPLNATATQYVGVHLSGGNIVQPFPDVPGAISDDTFVVVRARTTDGRWDLLQDNASESRVDALSGVDAFDVTGGYASRIEIHYNVGSIRVLINGQEGLSLEDDDVIVGAEGAIRHLGAGCFATTGSDHGGNMQAVFYDLLTDTFVP